MIDYKYVGKGEHLKQEAKPNWQMGTLTVDTYFVHGGPMGPWEVHRYGLNPLNAREFLTHAETNKPIAGGKMLFCFQIAGGALPANARKPGAVGAFWGFKGHSYVFKAPPGTKYWSTRALLTTGCEVAFPYVVESSDIVEYWAPSGSVNGAIQFQKVAWTSVLASRANAL